MAKPNLLTKLKLIMMVVALMLCLSIEFTEGGKPRIHITDDLEDVVDDEEDDEWKQWGKKSSSDEFDPPPSDFETMDLPKMQQEMMKRHDGPVFGFVKLRLGVRRTPDEVAEIATKWSKVVKTGGIQVNFVAVDLTTIMLTMQGGRDAMEIKQFILDDPEAYEIKIGNQVYRRPGDPPLEEVIENLQREKEKANSAQSSSDGGHSSDEL